MKFKLAGDKNEPMEIKKVPGRNGTNRGMK